MHNGIVNRRDKLQADNVNKPKLDTAFVTDNVSEHIVEIIDDHKEEIKPIIGGGGEPSYILDENITLGYKWIDGRDVKRRTIKFKLPSTTTPFNISLGIKNLKAVIDYSLFVTNTTEQNYKPYPGIPGNVYGFSYEVEEAKVGLSVTSPNFNMDAVLILYYTNEEE